LWGFLLFLATGKMPVPQTMNPIAQKQTYRNGTKL
jgi:hypothetical protein